MNTPDQPPPLPPHAHAPQNPSGLLVIDKPLGCSSMHVCRVIRRRLINAGAPKRVKVGHGGTLDPLATGLLVILVGKATPLCDLIMAGSKSYIADVDLSAFTATDDREGQPAPVPLGPAGPPTREHIAAALPRFIGVIQQRPPAYSALKVDGHRAYDLARAGSPPDLPPRPVRIDAITLTAYHWPIASLLIHCGKGVYIRSLARDLGIALNTGGHLAALRRTKVGPFTIDAARTLDSIPNNLTAADLLPIPPVSGLIEPPAPPPPAP